MERRKRSRVDYAAMDGGADRSAGGDAGASSWVPYLHTRDFADAEPGFVERLASGDLLNLAWARRTGLKQPAIISDARGSGLTVPRASGFGPREVAEIIGEAMPVAVMRVKDQSEIRGWSLGDWATYWEGAAPRKETLNVISLEFSKTALAERVRSPALVRRVDWIDNAWPEQLRARGEYPQTQYYCLMSAAGCYTDFHVDFGGTAVWYHVLQGRKVFYLIKPTDAHLALYEKWICSQQQDTEFFADLLPDARNATARIELRAGETLFIPSAWIHAVYTPEDSLVFGGNFLPGLCTLREQLAIHGIEQRTRVAQQFRFPYFQSCMFFGLAETRRRVRQQGLGELTVHELSGLRALLAACAVWAAGNDAGLSSAQARDHARLAARDVGCATPALLVQELQALVGDDPEPVVVVEPIIVDPPEETALVEEPVAKQRLTIKLPAPKPRFTIKLPSAAVDAAAVASHASQRFRDEDDDDDGGGRAGRKADADDEDYVAAPSAAAKRAARAEKARPKPKPPDEHATDPEKGGDAPASSPTPVADPRSAPQPPRRARPAAKSPKAPSPPPTQQAAKKAAIPNTAMSRLKAKLGKKR